MKAVNMRRSLFALAIPALLTSVPLALAADGDVLARVGDSEVTTSDLQPILSSLQASDKAALEQDPSLLNQTVRSLLVQQLLYKEAIAKGWDKDPTVVAQLERQRKNLIAETYLRSVAEVPAGYPGDAEIQAAYDSNKAALVVPRQLELAQIFVALPKDADQAAIEKTNAKLAAIRKNLNAPGADFAAIATTESDDAASAQRGGSLGWLTDAQLQPEVRAKITGLTTGAITEPVRLDDGWHLIKLTDVRESRTAKLDEVRDQLAERLAAQRLRANSNAYLTKLLQENPVAINEIALSQLLEPARN